MVLFGRTKRGVSLLELLIVMTIIVMVTAAAIPIMLPALQNRRMRETGRLVSSYLSSARSRAIETGRPVGVMFERFNGQPYCISLAQVEVPPPYAGDSNSSTLLIDPAQGKIVNFTQMDFQWLGLLRYGDVVKIGYHSQPYLLVPVSASPTALNFNDPNVWQSLNFGKLINDPPAAGNWFLVNFDGTLPAFPQSYGSAPGAPFQILRQPTRSATAPLQLPEGCVVDLLASGMNFGGNFLGPGGTPNDPFSVFNVATNPLAVTFNPIITFAPGGSVDYVYATTSTRPTGPLFFLLGRRELLPDVSKSRTDENLYDPADPKLTVPAPVTTYPPTYLCLSNFWISIGHQTGLVTVSEAAPNPPVPGPAVLTNSRAYAQSAQGVSGM